MKKYFLEVVVFICGAVVMVYEIVGSRVLGPYLGTSIFIWTSLIGIILGSLSLGYWLGGRLADKTPSYTMLAWIIVGSAIFILLTTIFKEILLNHIQAIIPGLRGQSVVSSILLFAPASIFLGMVSPYAVRLKLKNLETSGSTVGNLYAISTIGSIAGTFLAGFLLIPLIGTTKILFSLAIIQSLLAILLLATGQIRKKIVVPLALLVFSVYTLWAFTSRKMLYADVDTQYNRVWIYDAFDKESGEQVKYMRINNESSSAMFLDSDSLVFPYARYYRLAEYFTPGFRSGLLLGGAAYSYPKYFLKKYPAAKMDVVEIDPELTRLAREHFRLKDDPRMGIIHEDARTFMNRSNKKYDVIYGDLFRSQYTLPWHLTTREAVQEYFDALNEEGCMLVNIISSIQGKGSEFLSAELATFQTVFPHVYAFAVYDRNDTQGIQSIMLAAVKSVALPPHAGEDPELKEFWQNEITMLIPAGIPVLTDDHAPVDYYMEKAIK